MMRVELKSGGIDTLEDVYLNNGKFSHKTGKTIKIFPFTTKHLSACNSDFASFQGIVGECFRLADGKTFDKEFSSDKEIPFKKKLRNHVINGVLTKVDTEKSEEFKDIVINLFFDEEDGGLIKFNKEVLPYLNFFHNHNQLNETARYFYEIFLDNDVLSGQDLTASANDNVFYQLIVESLPELKSKKKGSSSSQYLNLFEEIKAQFVTDLNYLASNEEMFLKHIEDLFKYYYFFYLTQVANRLNTFGSNNEIRPVFFSMDWETLSESRLTYLSGWKRLQYDLVGFFAHANTIELLNYIEINGESVGDYQRIREQWNSMNEAERRKLIDQIQSISSFYKSQILNLEKPFHLGFNWENCEERLIKSFDSNTRLPKDELGKELFSLFYRVDYQFKYSGRSARYNDYAKWFNGFCHVNFLKTRGRLGSTTVINQEFLLFLTKLCVGQEDKIRLNELWERLNLRGITFDETSKGEIIKLFERINLLEKKSDSGDAQYVKSII